MASACVPSTSRFTLSSGKVTGIFEELEFAATGLRRWSSKKRGAGAARGAVDGHALAEAAGA